MRASPQFRPCPDARRAMLQQPLQRGVQHRVLAVADRPAIPGLRRRELLRETAGGPDEMLEWQPRRVDPVDPGEHLDGRRVKQQLLRRRELEHPAGLGERRQVRRCLTRDLTHHVERHPEHVRPRLVADERRHRDVRGRKRRHRRVLPAEVVTVIQARTARRPAHHETARILLAGFAPRRPHHQGVVRRAVARRRSGGADRELVGPQRRGQPALQRLDVTQLARFRGDRHAKPCFGSDPVGRIAQCPAPAVTVPSGAVTRSRTAQSR